jgi:hypothetical protein
MMHREANLFSEMTNERSNDVLQAKGRADDQKS